MRYVRAEGNLGDSRLTFFPVVAQLNEPVAAESEVASSDGRMTKEQLGELAEALSILSAKSSIVKEKEELKQLMESNISEEVRRRARLS